MYNKKKLFTQIMVFFSSIAIATAVMAEPSHPIDPYEPFNRAMFRFNDIVDKYILKPLATLYNKITPKPLRQGFSNFYLNIDTVPTIFNDLLQANFYQAANDIWRLGINTTIGLLGLIDVASRIGLEPNTEDFGLTLARWGYTKSNYLVLPFIGPSTVRDAIGFPINYYYLSVYPHIEPDSTRYALYGFGIIVRRSDLLRFENVMQQAALDKYVFLRDAYLQRRQYLMERNKQLSNPYAEESQEAAPEEASVAQTAETVNAGKKEVKTEEATRPFSDI